MKKYTLMVLAVFLLMAVDSSGDDAKKDQEKFQGPWTVTRGEHKGQPVPEEELKKLKLTIAGDKISVKIEDQTIESTFKLDPSKKPKEIDITQTEGPDKGKMIPGIYEFDGDELKLCVDDDGKTRPTEFASKADKALILLVLKKAKP